MRKPALQIAITLMMVTLFGACSSVHKAADEPIGHHGTGNVVEFHPNGKVKREAEYRDGELVSVVTYYASGTEESNELGSRLIDMTLDSFMFIGTVSAPNPIYASNRLVNFETPRTWSYAYYRVYPYRPQQWALTE